MARSFDGTNDYLTIGSALATGYPFSMACWARVPNLTGDKFVFQIANTGSANDRAGLYVEGTAGRVWASVRNGTSTRAWRTTAGVTDGTWFSAVGTFSSSTVNKSYLNGDSTGAYGATNTAAMFSANNSTLGALRRSSVSYSDCDIAEVAFWDVVLTDAEAAMLAAGYSPQFIRPQNLVGYWPLFGRAGASGGEEAWVGSASFTANDSPALVDHPRIIYPHRRAAIFVPAASAGPPTLTGISAGSITSSGATLTITAS